MNADQTANWENRLSRVVEMAGCFVSAKARLDRFGSNNPNPEGHTQKSNIQLVREELGKLRLSIEFFDELDRALIQNDGDRKQIKDRALLIALQRFKDNKPILTCISKILQHLYSYDRSLSYITHSSLAKTHGLQNDQIHFEMIDFLCEIGVLTRHFELWDGSEDSIDIDDEEMALANETGMMIHPDTGKEFPDWEDKITDYFSFDPKTPIKSDQMV